MAFSCPTCHHTPVEVVEFTDDARTRLRCGDCAHEWLHSPPAPIPAVPRERTASGRPRLSRDEAKAHFPTEADLTDATRERVAGLKRRFLAGRPQPDPAVAPYWRRYQHIFSAEGLPTADPSDLKAFANNTVGANPGNMSVFNTAWNRLGDQQAAERVRRVVDHLLRGTDEPHIEDRMQALLDGDSPIGMTGFRESLLTRVLCIVEPARFLPILIYTSRAGGKKEIAASVFGLDLPARRSTSMTTGRLAFWSNDLLLRLCGAGFADVAHASEFLWWAKDES